LNKLISVIFGIKASIGMDWCSEIEKRLLGVIETTNNVSTIRFIGDMKEFCYQVSKDESTSHLILMSEIGETPVNLQFLLMLKKLKNNLKIIPILRDDEAGSFYAKGLLDAGYYNALFERDVEEDKIVDMILNDRSYQEAKAYYESPGQGYSNQERATAALMGRRRVDESENSYKKDIEVKCGLDILKDEHTAMSYIQQSGVIEPVVKQYHIEDELEKYSVMIQEYYRRHEIQTLQSFETGEMSKDEFVKSIKAYISKLNISNEMEDKVFDTFARYMWSYGKLDVLLDAREISDIRLLSPETVTIQIKGCWYYTDIKFCTTKDEYTLFINRLCTKNQAALNNQNAQPIFSDIKTNPLFRLRFQVSSGYINSSEMPSVHIRKIAKQKLLAEDLIKENFWSANEAAFLIHEIKAGRSLIFCGGSGSGKTVALNCLIEHLDENICGVCIQEVEELFSDTKRNIEFQHSVYMKGEGKANYTLRDLATMALLKNASLFVIGEIKGNEARDFFTASNTGGQCLCTTHAQSARDALPRIADLAKYVGDYTQKDILKMLSRSIGYIIYLHNYKIANIVQVSGWDNKKEEVAYEDIIFM